MIRTINNRIIVDNYDSKQLCYQIMIDTNYKHSY